MERIICTYTPQNIDTLGNSLKVTKRLTSLERILSTREMRECGLLSIEFGAYLNAKEDINVALLKVNTSIREALHKKDKFLTEQILVIEEVDIDDFVGDISHMVKFLDSKEATIDTYTGKSYLEIIEEQDKDRNNAETLYFRYLRDETPEEHTERVRVEKDTISRHDHSKHQRIFVLQEELNANRLQVEILSKELDELKNPRD